MKVEQLSIFLENKTGRLADVTKALAGKNINIRALALADTSDFGILRVIVDRTEEAKKLLKDAGFTVGRTAVVAVRVEDVPGGLSKILEILTQHKVNVEYMYAFVQSGGQHATMLFRFDKVDAALALLEANGIPTLSAEEINGGL